LKIIRVTHPSLIGLPRQDFDTADVIFYRPEKAWWKPWQKADIFVNKTGKTGKCSLDDLNKLIRDSGNTRISVCETS
jgi:hypothetical protein